MYVCAPHASLVSTATGRGLSDFLKLELGILCVPVLGMLLLNPAPLQEQVLLTTEPSLLPFALSFDLYNKLI